MYNFVRKTLVFACSFVFSVSMLANFYPTQIAACGGPGIPDPYIFAFNLSVNANACYGVPIVSRAILDLDYSSNKVSTVFCTKEKEKTWADYESGSYYGQFEYKYYTDGLPKLYDQYGYIEHQFDEKNKTSQDFDTKIYFAKSPNPNEDYQSSVDSICKSTTQPVTSFNFTLTKNHDTKISVKSLADNKFTINVGQPQPYKEITAADVAKLATKESCSLGEIPYAQPKTIYPNLTVSREISCTFNLNGFDFTYPTINFKQEGELPTELEKQIQLKVGNISSNLSCALIKSSYVAEKINTELEIVDKLNCTVSIPENISEGNYPVKIQDTTNQLNIDLGSFNIKNKFNDVSKDHTFAGHIYTLRDEGIINGFSPTAFGPDASVTRGQMAKFIKNTYGFNDNINCTPFSDVPSSDTFYKEIMTLKCNNIINGFEDGTFRPLDNVTREQMMKFAIKGARIKYKDTDNTSFIKVDNDAQGSRFDDVSSNNPFYEYITAGYNNYIVSGNYDENTSQTYFNPSSNVTRGATAKIIYNSRYAALSELHFEKNPYTDEYKYTRCDESLTLQNAKCVNLTK